MTLSCRLEGASLLMRVSVVAGSDGATDVKVAKGEISLSDAKTCRSVTRQLLLEILTKKQLLLFEPKPCRAVLPVSFLLVGLGK